VFEDYAGEASEGTTVTAVEKGVLQIAVDGPAELTRHNGSVEMLGAGSDTTLVQGDRLLAYARTHRTIRPLAEPATFLELSDHAFNVMSGVDVDLAVQGIDPETLPPGPLSVTVRRVTLEAGQPLQRPAPEAVVFLAVEEGSVQVALSESFPGTPDTRRPFTYPVGTSTVVSTGRDDAKAVRAAADGPATLLVVTISPLVNWE
jgi:hypothetical protein